MKTWSSDLRYLYEDWRWLVEQEAAAFAIRMLAKRGNGEMAWKPAIIVPEGKKRQRRAERLMWIGDGLLTGKFCLKSWKNGEIKPVD